MLSATPKVTTANQQQHHQISLHGRNSQIFSSSTQQLEKPLNLTHPQYEHVVNAPSRQKMGDAQIYAFYMNITLNSMPMLTQHTGQFTSFISH